MLDLSPDIAPPQPVRLADYRPPEFLVDSVDLVFDLDGANTRVKARLAIRRNPEGADPKAALELDGEELELVAVALDGEALGTNRYRLPAEGGLVIDDVPDAFALEIETIIAPDKNTALSGLYMSGGNFCTQCEPEGFRRITYFIDRPDVMARYATTIVADQARFPVLLSNGNPAGSDAAEGGQAEDGRHWVKWVDPHPKPSYLFALVAGDLVAVRDRFTTRSGREVALAIWVRRGDEDKCGHAMASLKKAMRWDEDVFGLEYDLDVFNIVAVSDFNMGAMENKGLNIFNTRYVLAKPDTATDLDYQNIESVIAHEYFHNWTGNRVTCRDWFQLSLKEGLTVFRDQEFSADQGSRAVRRIGEVRTLRAIQFSEDDGPLAHPVRPESYLRIDNFYTATVYNKGAELVRMIHTLVGADGFRRGMDLYIARHDNHAATIEDFVAAMQQASGVDLGRFKRWYAQAGTPELTVEDRWDAARNVYELTVAQQVPPTPGQPDKLPMLIPLAIGLLGADGGELPARLAGEAVTEGAGPAGTRVLALSEARQTFRFVGLPAAPVPSVLRGFSAPVKLKGVALERLKFLASARCRAVRPLGGGPGGGGPGPARPDRGAAPWRRRGAARCRSGDGDAPDPRRCRARPGLCRRGIEPAERVVSRRPARGGRCRRGARRTRGRPRRDRPGVDRGIRCRLHGAGRSRTLPDRRRGDRPAGVAQHQPRLSRRRRSRTRSGAGQGAVRRRRQYDRRPGGADGTGRSRPPRAGGGVGGFFRRLGA